MTGHDEEEASNAVDSGSKHYDEEAASTVVENSGSKHHVEEANNAVNHSPGPKPPGLRAIHVKDLPPLPTPDIRSMQNQAGRGFCLVIATIIALVGLTHGIALTIGFDEDTVAWWIVFWLIYTQTGLALIFFVGVLLVDPGTIPRTPEHCFPLPPRIQHWLVSKNDELRPIEQYLTAREALCENNSNNNERDTFCTRCLVWRRQPQNDGAKPIRYFHCNTCQRCIRYFDHHCNVFGRCVGGTLSLWGPGNLKYFWGIILTGLTAYLTCLGSVLGGLIHSYDPRWVVPFFIAGLVLLNCMSPVLNNILGAAGRKLGRMCC